MEHTTRKSLYFMPFLLIDETIECKEVRLIKNNRQYDSLMPDIFKNCSGIYVEIVDYIEDKNLYLNHVKSLSL